MKSIYKFKMLILPIIFYCLNLPAQSQYRYTDSRFINDPSTDSFVLSWWGYSNRAFFIQYSEDLENWSYITDYTKQGTNAEMEFNLATSSSPFFLRLNYAPQFTTNPGAYDFDGDTFSSQDELDLGMDPLGFEDADENGIPDEIDTLWSNVPGAWKDAFVNDPNKAFYDPQDSIDGAGKVLPGDDYDGDGIINLIEYNNGTDPLDFFNGDTPILSICWGDNQTVQPEKYSEKSLYVKVQDAEGNSYLNAPVRYEIASGHNGQLSRNKATVDTDLATRTFAAGAVAYFRAPALASGTEISDVIVSLPDGQSVVFSLTTDAGYVITHPPYDFKMIDNGDGTTTYTWRSDNPSGDFFVREEQPIRSGNWVQLFSVPYSSLTPTGNLYTVTVDSNYVIQ